jgi:TetR/AcrR family tetracycline transcriptional repressor
MTTPYVIALDHALAEVEIPKPDPSEWAGQLAVVARRLREVMSTRDLVPPWGGMPPAGSRVLGCHDGVLAIMQAGGVPDSRSVAGLHLLWLIVSGISLEELRCAAAQESPPQSASDYLESLPADRFPNLTAVAGELAEQSLDARFELLLSILINGLAGA